MQEPVSGYRSVVGGSTCSSPSSPWWTIDRSALAMESASSCRSIPQDAAAGDRDHLDTASVPHSRQSVTDDLEPHRIDIDLLMAPVSPKPMSWLTPWRWRSVSCFLHALNASGADSPTRYRWDPGRHTWAHPAIDRLKDQGSTDPQSARERRTAELALEAKNPQPEPGVLSPQGVSVADQLMVIGIMVLTMVLVLT